MFTISVCMIVKDEQDVILRILNCAKEFADEIIIVDTGSKDNTVNICKTYTKNIYYFEWCNDFAKARNFSFSKATKDYIMWLDADDLISPENIQKIIRLKNTDSPADCYMFKYVMGFVEGAPTFEFYRERLLNRSSDFEWVGFVHEAIAPQGKIIYTDIEIEHRKIKASDPKRNLKLYRYAIRHGVAFNPREQYYYSRELYFNGHYKKAITELNKYLKSGDTYIPNITGAHLILAKCYLATNQPQKAKLTLVDSIATYMPSSETCCVLANTFEILHKINMAILWYNIALITPKNNDGFVQKDYYDYIPYIELCRLYYRLDYNKSKYYFLKAKELKPNANEIIHNQPFFE